MKRLLIIIVLGFVLTLSSSAQDRTLIEGREVYLLVKEITEAHEGIRSITSDFVQKKRSVLFSEDIVQKGNFQYEAPDTLIWKYTWPVEMKFDLGTATDKMSLMLKDMIVNTVTGAMLTDTKSFKVTYYTTRDETISVVLVPLAKRLQKMYKELTIVLDGTSLYAESISFVEANDDQTIIIFNNQEVWK